MKRLGWVLSFLMFFVTLGWYLTVIGLVFSLFVVLVSPFVPLPNMRLTIPVSFSVDPAIVRVTPAPGVAAQSGRDDGVRIGSGGFALEVGRDARTRREPQIRVRGSLRFPTESRLLFVGTAALLAVFLAFVLWVLRQVRGVFRTLRAGTPFVADNARRLHRIAFAVIIGEVARATIVFVENYYAMTHFSAEGLRFDARPDFNILAVFSGLIILAIAEVFRAGTRLDEDQSLTV
jgi:hypothetical protein